MRGLTIIAAVMLPTVAFAADLSGPARAIDGDTIRIGEQRIRLWGISAPELREPYGALAKEALSVIIADQTSVCEDTGRRSHGRIVAKCRVRDVDIGRVMVMFGFAKDCPRYSGGAYAGDENPETALPFDVPRYCRRRQ